MIPRASGALLYAYTLLAFAGVVFLFVPSSTFETVSDTPAAAIIWGLFYLVGSLIAAASLIARKFVENTTPLWYFEVSGISLIIAANLVYSYTLATSAIDGGKVNVFGTALVVLAFSGGLVARAVETLRLVRTLKRYSRED